MNSIKIKYNLSLLGANSLFALNFSLFVSLLESLALSIGTIYILQCFALMLISATLFLIVAHPPIRFRAGDLISIALISIVSSLGWSYMMLWGMSLTSPIDAATIASVGPSLTLIFAHALHRRQLSGKRIAGVALSLLGVAILVINQSLFTSSQHEIKGNILLLGAVVVAAVNTLILKPHLERYGVIRVALIYAIATIIVSVPLFGGAINSLSTLSLGWSEGAELTLLIVVGSTLPLMLLFEGTEYLTPLHTSLYRYLQPLIAAVVVVARKQAELTLSGIVALIVIIAGGILVAQGVDKAE
ncbi:MAG: DMT family transporter [Rikenellaceae bacterium]